MKERKKERKENVMIMYKNNTITPSSRVPAAPELVRIRLGYPYLNYPAPPHSHFLYEVL